MTEAKIEFDRDKPTLKDTASHNGMASLRANQYNLDIRKAIPGYESLHGMAYSLLQTSLSKSARLLIVGSGTGMELVNYSQQHPAWTLTGVDPSAEMMAIAKSELANQGLSERINLHTGYIAGLPQIEPVDAATSILVMHFLPNNGAKLELLKNIAQRLKLGAKLILVDLYGDKSAPYFTQFTKAWQSLYFSKLEAETKAKAEANFQTSISNSIYFVTEARIIQLLQTAGFSEVTKFYNAFLFGGPIAKYTGS